MNILILAPDYPNVYRASFEFVKNLVDALADRGNHCYVIAPYSVTREKRFWRGTEFVKMDNGGSVTVVRPNTFTFSNWKIGRFNFTELSTKVSIKIALNSMKFKPDVAYGHFWSCGKELYMYAKERRIPLYVATGESVIPNPVFSNKELISFRDYVKGVVCVSSKNRDESIELGLTTSDKCLLVPNGIDNRMFRVLDKQECRKQLGLPQDCFIVAFLGWFKHVKGPRRLAAALDSIRDGETVYSIFIGAGLKEDPICNNILFKGRLKHHEIPPYLNSADVFVLPTLHEGCCNAIIEAMACGLPIISSNLPFNWDVLNNRNSIMIDPNNISDIANAIKRLRDDKTLRMQLRQGAIETAKDLTIDKRAAKIEEFIKSTM